MGKGAGNLPSELIIEYLNATKEKQYDLSKLYEVIDNIIKKYQKDYTWGYCPEYLMSAKNGCTPSFVNYFIKKYKSTLSELNELLKMLNKDKKISSNNEHAEEVYQEYLVRKIK